MVAEMDAESEQKGAADFHLAESDEIQLWSKWRETGDECARSALLNLHLPYARIVAATHYGRRTASGVEFAEYLQIASAALIESMNRYDPRRGILFRTFAAHRIRGALIDGIGATSERARQINVRSRLLRERSESICHFEDDKDDQIRGAETSKEEKLFSKLAEVGIGLALGMMLEGTGMIQSEAESDQVASVSYFRETELRQLQAVVRNLVSRLSDREQVVIRSHYLQGEDFAVVANRLGVTRGRIAQVHRSALNKLLELLRASPEIDVAL
ncbi:MAG: sigma-70 family RNA polymerase sigma factor [Betaproteobacteria bacterium]|nr:sigma-70 family RNA polymerase sigma factor [Betaproteobacteria bacterium]